MKKSPNTQKYIKHVFTIINDELTFKCSWLSLEYGTLLINFTFHMSMPWRLSGRVQIWLHWFLISTPNRGEWLTSRRSRCNPGKESSYPLNGRQNGPQSRCESYEEKNSNPAPSSSWLGSYTDNATPPKFIIAACTFYMSEDIVRSSQKI
jgi:hypothetical protein